MTDLAARSNPDAASISSSKQKPLGNLSGIAGLARKKKIEEVVRLAKLLQRKSIVSYNEMFPLGYAYMEEPGWVPLDESTDLDEYLSERTRETVGLPPLSPQWLAANAAPDLPNDDPLPPVARVWSHHSHLQLTPEIKMAMVKHCGLKGMKKNEIKPFFDAGRIPFVTYENHKAFLSENAPIVAICCKLQFKDGKALVRAERTFVKTVLKAYSVALAVNDHRPYTVIIALNPQQQGLGHNPIEPEIYEESELGLRPTPQAVGPSPVDFVSTESQVIRFVVPRKDLPQNQTPEDCAVKTAFDWLSDTHLILHACEDSAVAKQYLKEDVYPWFPEAYLTTTIREETAGTIHLFADKKTFSGDKVFKCLSEIHKLDFAIIPNNGVFRFHHRRERLDLQKLQTLRTVLAKWVGSESLFKVFPDVRLEWGKKDNTADSAKQRTNQAGSQNFIIVRTTAGRTITPDLVRQLVNGDVFKSHDMKFITADMTSIKIGVSDATARKLHRTYLDSGRQLMWYYPRMKAQEAEEMEAKIRQELDKLENLSANVVVDGNQLPSQDAPVPSFVPPLSFGPPSAPQATALDAANPVPSEEQRRSACEHQLLQRLSQWLLARKMPEDEFLPKLANVLFINPISALEAMLKSDTHFNEMVQAAGQILSKEKRPSTNGWDDDDDIWEDGDEPEGAPPIATPAALPSDAANDAAQDLADLAAMNFGRIRAILQEHRFDPNAQTFEHRMQLSTELRDLVYFVHTSNLQPTKMTQPEFDSLCMYLEELASKQPRCNEDPACRIFLESMRSSNALLKAPAQPPQPAAAHRRDGV